MQASILAVVTLGVVLWLSLGKFQLLLLSLLCAVVAMTGAGMWSRRAAAIGARWSPERLLALAALWGAGLLAVEPHLIYAEVAGPYYALRVALGGLVVAIAVGLALTVSDPDGARGTRWLVFGTIGLLVAQLLVPFASPHPLIDVFVTNSAAVDFLLGGSNPYATTYPDVYRGAYDFIPGFGYPPGTLWLLVPFRLLGDVRFASIAANAASVALMRVLAQRAGLSRRTGWTMCLAFVAFPVSMFVVEQAWIDPLLVTCTLALALAVGERRWLLAGALVGLAISVKQYAVLLVLPSAVFGWRVGGRKAVVRASSAAAAAMGALFLPFALLDWPAFYHQLAGTLLQRELRSDSLSIAALVVNATGESLPETVLAGVVLASAIGFAVWLAGVKRVGQHDWLTAIVMTFGSVFLFGKQAFCNYYYLLAALFFARALAPRAATRA